jgi:cobalt/nickel transport system permease protein
VTRRNGFLLAGLLVALVLAGVVSGFASTSPDGLEKVAQDKGFAETAEDHALAGSPVADYGVESVEDERLSTGLAGVIGVGITFAFGLGLFALVKRRDTRASSPDDVEVPSP